MTYNQFERAVSTPRLNKYLAGCGNDKRKAMRLYKLNIQLSQKLFAVLSVFEVVLRNSIDRHYIAVMGNDWLVSAIDDTTGYLNSPGCEHSLHSINEVVQNLSIDYTHDKGIAAMNFGFWTFKFGTKEFPAAGNTLLSIFAARPPGTSQKDIFKRMQSINNIRNRIAHHEPICFNAYGSISTNYALTK